MESWSQDSTDIGLVNRTIERWRQRLHTIRRS
jgi:hypothetical protein